MTQVTINNNQSNAIKLIRAISALMIVWCHIFQGLNNELAWWFNVGVQIFLFMSGFLMAKDHINSPSIFLKKRLNKILIPYYILLFITIFIYNIFNIEISLNNTLTYIFCLQGITYNNIIPGLEHLWFISIIIICYILTLILNTQRERMIKNKSSYITVICFLFLVQVLINISSLPTAFGARIGAFIIGYFVACRYQYSISSKLFKNISIITVTTLLIRLYFTYISPIESIKLNNVFNNYFVNWQHTLLGYFIFIAIYYNFSLNCNSNNTIFKLLNTISKYSYEIYLVHQIFIIGPISILFLTKYLTLNLTIIFVLITLLAILINKISVYLKKYIFK